jgi:hypothetical protein
LDLIGEGYELKAVFPDGKAEFGYLQKGPSMFRCVLSQFDVGINQLSEPTFLCTEMTKPYRRGQ